MDLIKVYLGGPIKGQTLSGAAGWRRQLNSDNWAEGFFEFLNPMRVHEEELPDGPVDQGVYNSILRTQRGVYARDRFDVMRSDVLLVNFLGATRVSIGSVMEIGWAKADPTKSRIVVVVMEKEGNLHDHWFINESTDYRVETLVQAISVLWSLVP